MYFGVDYHPESWVFPYAGTAENPEAQWVQDAQLMTAAGFNVARIGEFSWVLCETEDGKFNFDWLRRVMDVLGEHGIKVVLGTPTAAPPIWLAKKFPEILPIDENGQVKHEGTRRAACLNSDVYWNHSKRIVEEMAKALGKHPQLIAWQIDNSLGGHFTEAAFNEDSRRDWHLWLEAKFETIARLNECLGLRHWGQVVSAWNQVPMPMASPTLHNPALVLNWCRFCSDTIVQFVKMQAEILREATPDDVGGILALIEPLESDGTLVRRGRHQIECDIDHFSVIEHDGVLFGCAALYPYTSERIGEMACLTVSPEAQGTGDGERLLKRIEQRARARGLTRIFVLTTRTEHWFLKRGFVKVTVDDLPEDRRRLYNWQRKSLVLMKQL